MRDPCSQHEPDAALALRAALAPQFMTLRRLLAQLGGLVLLSDSRRSETQDGVAVSLSALRADLAEVEDSLRRAQDRLACAALSLHRMGQAAGQIGQALALMDAQIMPGRLPEGDSRANRVTVVSVLQHAQRLLLSIADDRAGLVMVGFSHACCCPARVNGRDRHCA